MFIPSQASFFYSLRNVPVNLYYFNYFAISNPLFSVFSYPTPQFLTWLIYLIFIYQWSKYQHHILEYFEIMPEIYIYILCSFLIYFWSCCLSPICFRDKVIQTASHSCYFLSLGFNFFYQISWTGNVYTQTVKIHNLLCCAAINFQLAAYKFFAFSRAIP